MRPKHKKILCSCAKAVAMQFRLGYYKQGCEAMKNWVTRDGYVLGQKEYIKVEHFHGENIESYLALCLTIHNNDTIFRWQKYFCFFNFNVCVFFYKPPKKLQTIKLLITSCPPLPISLTKGPSDHLAWPIGFVSLSKAEISFVKVLLRSNSDKSSRVKFNSYEQRPLSKTFTTTLWKTSKYLREALFHLISTHRRGTDTRYKTEKFRNGLR